MAFRPPIVVCFVLASALLARAGDGDAYEPHSPEPVRYGPAPEGLRLEIKAPKTSYWPGERIRPEVVLVNGSDKAISVVLPRDGSETGTREPSLSWTAVYVARGGKETPVAPLKPFRCGNGFDLVWQDDVVELEAGKRAALERVEDPRVTVDLQEPGKVRLRLRYAYSAGAVAKGLPDEFGVPKDTGAMGAQAPFELIGAVDVTIERPLDVTLKASSSRAAATARLTDILDVRAVGKDGNARTLSASQWDVQFQFDAPADLGLDTSKCWEPRTLARDAAVAAGGSATLALDPSLTLRTAKPGACRVRVVLRSLDPAGGARIVSAWTELRFTE